MNQAIEKIASVLRTDKDFIFKIEKRLSEVTGKKNVLEKIVEENDEKIKKSLLALGVSQENQAKDVYDALISKIEADDLLIFEALNKPAINDPKDCQKVVDVLKATTDVKRKGFFLKKERAQELLIKEPPKKIMTFLGYSQVEEMLEKEDFFEIFSALRFIEGNDWLNNVFFNQYKDLRPEDFEERDIEVKVLSLKWCQAARVFVSKKLHNISHLKELGVIFVIPLTLGVSGELLRMISLVFHYFHELDFYSQMFKKIKETPITFSQNLISLLKGEVIDKRMPETEKSLWLVIQRYLAKEDENEWRLFVPHINPEAIHWAKTTTDFVNLAQKIDGFEKELSFWQGLDWVGDYFKNELNQDVLVSFNLVDTVMSLVKEKEMIKYLYHQQEALWNKIFEAYFDSFQLEKFAKDYLLQGYFEV